MARNLNAAGGPSRWPSSPSPRRLRRTILAACCGYSARSHSGVFKLLRGMCIRRVRVGGAGLVAVGRDRAVRAQQLGASAIGLGREEGGKSIWAQPSRGAAATAPRTPNLRVRPRLLRTLNQTRSWNVNRALPAFGRENRKSICRPV